MFVSLLVLVTSSADVGTSQLIADGRIKLKHGSAISRFSSDGLYFEDGTHLDAEVVIFATG